MSPLTSSKDIEAGLEKAPAALLSSPLHCLQGFGSFKKKKKVAGSLCYLYFPGVVHDDQTEQDDRGETDKAFQS